MFNFSSSFSVKLFPTFEQVQYVGLENVYLSDFAFPKRISAPTLTIQFYIDDDDAPYNMARAIYVFVGVFGVWPATIRDTKKGRYRIYYTFPRHYSAQLLGFFMDMRTRTRSRYLNFHYSSNTPNYRFILKEPITFFPLVHPSFDYHDWVYPFEFLVSFSSVSDSNLEYSYQTVSEVFYV